ncbi:MAG: site-specific DNA-methyltransferase [Ignavibacteria bacterium]|nr:site-specific DNA-methyltransferase [Ignavibacteria bacterium]
MSDKLQKFKEVLREVFQLDQADLDFGIYRIMNQKRDDIESFLEKDLLPQVQALFSQHYAGDFSKLDEELQAAIQQAKELGVNPDTVPKVADLKARLSAAPNSEELADNVFSYLSNFFKRYYDNGDFLSQRRYKKDVYAIPYEGEEVKLYWANYDQYYIKTTEYFKNYSFKLSNEKKVNFKILEATTEQNNNLAAKAKERKFFIVQENPLALNNDDLDINFRYDFNEQKQKDLNTQVLESVQAKYLELAGQQKELIDFKEILDLRPTDKNKKRTLLEKHINDFTARNTFDYFIHKDLGGFLRRELDFFIKNEVLYIDDINELDEKQFHKQVSTIKVLKQIGHKIIAFLEQLENFQKKLWLKKKFVVETNYCITLDIVPEELYPDIIANNAQLEEWMNLFLIEEIMEDFGRKGFSNPLSIEFLKENQFLPIDTKYFDEDFNKSLLKSLDSLDKQLSGVLINSENSQAIQLLASRYTAQVPCIYIDPPYNTPHSQILYKNNYKHSSWLSLLLNVFEKIPSFFSSPLCLTIAIDDYELANLNSLINSFFANYDISTIVVNHHPQGAGGKISRTHEYLLIISDKGSPNYLGKPKEQNHEDRSFMRSGTAENNFRTGRWKSFYALLYDPRQNKIVSAEPPIPLQEEYPLEPNESGLIRIYPINSKNEERVWRSSYETGKNRAENGELLRSPKGAIYQAIDHEGKFETLFSNWTLPKYNAGINGSNLLADMGLGGLFDYPKSVYAVEDALWATTFANHDAIILDYFAGSGTTGHSVINMNRFDNGNRRYILIEMGEYFDKITLPRIKKAIYSKDWKDGKPVSREGISQCFKYLLLESYEDTLNNLQLKRTQNQQQALELNEQFREGYMLGYFLDVETEGSASLLNIEQFEDPFNYYLNITRNNEMKPTKVDLVETFNYLLGLVVNTIDELDGFRVITGELLNSEKILVIWRNTREKNNEDLNSFFSRIRVNIKDSEFDRIYVNGDNFLENMKIGEEKWKVVLIEEEFKKLMFEGT